MKKLLNTLYVTSEDSYLSLDGENVVVRKDDQDIGRLPLHNLESIVAFGHTGASPAFMGACADKNISLCFLAPSGRFRARVIGETRGNVLLRKVQYRCSDNPIDSTTLAKSFLLGKVYNSCSNLSRTIRDNGLRVNVPELESAREKLIGSLGCIKNAANLEELMGFEGEAAQVYFGVFDHMLINQKEEFQFTVRSRRPPLDKINAVLSFLYVLLANDCTAALETVGLDPYVGFMHRDRPGRASLALDLMEELRAVLADRLAVTLVNRGQISADGFVTKENGGVIMDDKTRKIILNEWQTKKRSEITHPFLKEKIEWGLVPHVQALLLARYLRGDLDAYPPFLWK